MIRTIEKDISGIYTAQNKIEQIYIGPNRIYKSPYYLPFGYRRIYGVRSYGKGVTINGFDLYSTNFRIRTKIKYTKYGGSIFYGIVIADPINGWRFFGAGGTWYFDNMKRTNGGKIDTSRTYNFELGNHYLKDLDTNTYILNTTANETYTTASQFKIFTTSDYGDIYELTMYHGDKEVAIFTPCVRKEDGMVGLYETMKFKTFFFPDGGGWEEIQ